MDTTVDSIARLRAALGNGSSQEAIRRAAEDAFASIQKAAGEPALDKVLRTQRGAGSAAASTAWAGIQSHVGTFSSPMKAGKLVAILAGVGALAAGYYALRPKSEKQGYWSARVERERQASQGYEDGRTFER